jgi:hypothetical protein
LQLKYRGGCCENYPSHFCRLLLKCDGTRAETRFRLSAKRTSPFKSAVWSVQSTTGSRGVRISGSNAGYTMFRGSVKGTGYPLHSTIFSSLSYPCVTVCHHISTGLYIVRYSQLCPCSIETQSISVFSHERVSKNTKRRLCRYYSTLLCKSRYTRFCVLLFVTW